MAQLNKLVERLIVARGDEKLVNVTLKAEAPALFRGKGFRELLQRVDFGVHAPAHEPLHEEDS